MRASKSIEESLKKNTQSKTVIRKTLTNQYNECLTLISIMSAQLPICKFAGFTCVSCFFTDASRAGLQFVKTPGVLPYITYTGMCRPAGS